MFKKSASLTGFVCILLSSLLFSTKAVCIKLAYAQLHINALTILVVRLALCIPFYLLALGGRHQSKQTHYSLSTRDYGYIFLLGSGGYYLSSILDFTGMQYVPASIERLLLFLYPSLVLLINRFVFKKRIQTYQKWALTITYIGIFIAFANKAQLQNQSGLFYFGSLLILLCSLTYAAYLAGSENLIRRVGATRFTAYVMLVACFCSVIDFLLRGNWQELQLLHELALWKYGSILAIGATLIPSFLLSYGIGKIDSNNAAIISTVGPISTIIQAHLILHEQLTWVQMLGTLLVLLGILLMGLKKTELAEG